MDDNLRDGDSESEVDLADLDAGPSTSRLHNLPSTSRQMRNEAEKKRRDTLNGYITELGRLVPMVDGTPRRVDKISILRLAATYLMQNQILYSSSARQPQFFPDYLDSYNLSHSMIEDMDAFMMVVTAAGKIVFVSHTVEKLLGHTQIDMFGQSLYNFTLKEDHSVLSFNLSSEADSDNLPRPPPAFEDSPDGGVGDDTNSSTSSSDVSATSPAPSVPAAPADPVPVELQKRSFFLQLSQKSVSRTEQPDYKRVHVLGNLRIPRLLSGTVKQRSKRHRTECPLVDGVGAGLETVLIAMVKLEHRIRELSLMEANKEEYVTRHLIDGRIVYSDHRISLVAGYFSEDVSGMSAFKFMHPEDVMFTIVALRQMYDRGEGFGCSCYRLQCANGNFVYLRTHGYLEKNEETNQVESFICVNTLVGRDIGKRLIQEMKARYSASIEDARLSSATIKEIEDEQQTDCVTEKLEEVISQLIPMNVDPPSIDTPFPDSQYMKAALTSKSLPSTSVQTAALSLGSPNRHDLERPSVITSSVRRRRRDSANEVASKRRRPDEVLTIQVSTDDLSRVQQEYSPSYVSPVKVGSSRRPRCLNPGPLTSPYKQELLSPCYDERLSSPRQYPGSMSQSNSNLQSVSFPSDPLIGPSGYPYTSTLLSPTDPPQQPLYTETLLNSSSEYEVEESNRVLYGVGEECMSPQQSNYNLKEEVMSPEQKYWNQLSGGGDGEYRLDNILNPSTNVGDDRREYTLSDILNQSGNGAGDASEYQLADVLNHSTNSTGNGSEYQPGDKLNQSTKDIRNDNDFQLINMLNQSTVGGRDDTEYPMAETQNQTVNRVEDRDEYRLTDMLNQSTNDPVPAFSRIESNLQKQNKLISLIQQDIKLVPQPPAMPLCNNLTMIMEEHKQHEIQLKDLRQKHKTLCEQNLNI